MPRRKTQRIKAKDTSIYDIIISELSNNSELLADYDMESIEIVIKKKYQPYINVSST